MFAKLTKDPFWFTIYILFGAVIVLVLANYTPTDQKLTRPENASMAPFVQRDIYVNHVRLRYIDEGSGPPIVLIHGHTGRIEEHSLLVDKLRRHFRVLAFDFPGSGYSDKPIRDYNLRFYEDTLLAFLDKLGIDKCYLAGGSLGGNLAIRLAARAPERFPRVVAWSPGSAWEARPTAASFVRLLDNYFLFQIVVRVQATFWNRPDWPGVEDNLLKVWEYYSETESAGFLKMYFGIAADQVGTSLFGVAPKVKQPLLLIWGESDTTPYMEEGIKKVCSLAPGCRFKSYPRAGHSVASEHPEEIVRDIQNFLR